MGDDVVRERFSHFDDLPVLCFFLRLATSGKNCSPAKTARRAQAVITLNKSLTNGET